VRGLIAYSELPIGRVVVVEVKDQRMPYSSQQ